MPEYELMYWPITGLGEPLRMTMAIGGLDFKNTTPANDENFQDRKAATGCQVPVLLVDGKPMGQSRAILRYLGRLLSYEGKPLYPTDAMEAYDCDQLIELVEDFRTPIVSTFGIQDQAEKEAARAAMFAEGGKMQKFLVKIDAYFKERPEKKTVDIGDIYAFCLMNMFRQPTFIDGIPADTFDQYENINKHHQWMSNIPPVLKYFEGNDTRAGFQPRASQVGALAKGGQRGSVFLADSA